MSVQEQVETVTAKIPRDAKQELQTAAFEESDLPDRVTVSDLIREAIAEYHGIDAEL